MRRSDLSSFRIVALDITITKIIGVDYYDIGSTVKLERANPEHKEKEAEFPVWGRDRGIIHANVITK